MNLVLGANGRLGQALLRELGTVAGAALPRSTYENWWQPGAIDEIRDFFKRQPPKTVVHVTCGVLDPARPAEEHRRVNTLLPMNIATAVAGLDVQVISFGTVLETVAGTKNPYVASKVELGKFAQAPGHRLLHLRLHTLYGGGPPAPFMFLGMMLAALRAGQPFPMTSGTQLREYHHVDDVARAVLAVAGRTRSGALDVSHGSPVRLKDLAEAVFSAAGRPDLLRIGALPSPAEDNYGSVFQATAGLDTRMFRDALTSVPAYVTSHV